MLKSFQEQLKQWKRDHVQVDEQRKKPKRKPPVKKPEKLSDRDLAFLMGSNMQTLRRGKGGAYK
ncbi:hypothetical protein M3184_05535 [Metabacillus litoralis]|nr:hypothetical protein [Metabacillus litoralis]MCM3651315.1 hypothetical protein [Metabacillus litoralis]